MLNGLLVLTLLLSTLLVGGPVQTKAAPESRETEPLEEIEYAMRPVHLGETSPVGETLAQEKAPAQPQDSTSCSRSSSFSSQSDEPRWTSYGGPEGGVPMHFAFSPDYANDQTVFSRSYGDVFRSIDNGDTWEVVLAGLGSEANLPGGWAAIDVSPAYTADRTVFATDYGLGVYKSAQRGALDTWHPITTGLTTLNVRPVKISPNYADDRTVFVGTDDGVFKSTDAGTSWTRVVSDLTDLDVWALGISPDYANDQTLFAGTKNAGVFKSTNGGANWTQKSSTIGNAHIRRIVPSPNYAVDQTVFVGARGRLFKSSDAGETWTEKL
jgi:photosystem II stability/assembly factor-like uncharacterized protein